MNPGGSATGPLDTTMRQQWHFKFVCLIAPCIPAVTWCPCEHFQPRGRTYPFQVTYNLLRLAGVLPPWAEKDCTRNISLFRHLCLAACPEKAKFVLPSQVLAEAHHLLYPCQICDIPKTEGVHHFEAVAEKVICHPKPQVAIIGRLPFVGVSHQVNDVVSFHQLHALTGPLR